MLRECEGDGNAVVVIGGGVVAVNAGCEYMGGPGVVSSANNVLDMSVVRNVYVFVSGRGMSCGG